MRKIWKAVFWFVGLVFIVANLASAILYFSYPTFDHPTQSFPSYGAARTLGCLTETVYQESPDYWTLSYFGLTSNQEKSKCASLPDMGKMKFHEGFHITVSPQLPDAVLRTMIDAPRLQIQENNRRTYLYRHIVSCEGNPLCERTDQYLMVITETKIYPDNATVEYYSRRLQLRMLAKDGTVLKAQDAEVFTRGYEYLEGGLIYSMLLAFCSFIFGLATFFAVSLVGNSGLTKKVGQRISHDKIL